MGKIPGTKKKEGNKKLILEVIVKYSKSETDLH